MARRVTAACGAAPPLWVAALQEAGRRLRAPYFLQSNVLALVGPQMLSAVYARASLSSSVVRRVQCVTGHAGACLPTGSVELFPCGTFHRPVEPARSVRTECTPALLDSLQGALGVHWGLVGWRRPGSGASAANPRFVQLRRRLDAQDSAHSTCMAALRH